MIDRSHRNILVIIALSTLLSVFAPPLRAEDRELVLADPARVIEPAVTFLSDSPLIDGRLDVALESLPVRRFTHIDKTNDADPEPDATYRLGYGTSFLYLFVKIATPDIVYRDRAFQNGDGFHMVLAAPRAGDEPTDEFYVLACSAVNDQAKEWTRHVFWYHDVDTIFERTSDDTLLAFESLDGSISFELLLPWKDVPPFHPWLSDGIGFNLRLVKAWGEADRVRYSVLDDPDISRENRPRDYCRLTFDPPALAAGMQGFVRLERGHIDEGSSLEAVLGVVSAKPASAKLRGRIATGEGDAASAIRIDMPTPETFSIHRFPIESAVSLPPGGYRLEWRMLESRSSGVAGFSVLPAFDPAAIEKRIASLPPVIRAGSRTTMLLLAAEIEQDLRSKRADETCGVERLAIAKLLDRIAAAESGRDEIATHKGFLRRGFRSKIDDLLQPYAAIVPDSLDGTTSLPLVVYLHGSASDETDLERHLFVTSDDVVSIAPYGRGPSHGWHDGHAQEDVAEAIADAIANYPIDNERIVLAGFSMGGYGVYRTFLEHSGRYRAIASFSGAPSISPDAPGFLDDVNLAAFRGVPVFVFHGERDRNLPIEPVRLLVEKLRQAGAVVTFVTEPDKGHEAPGEETIRLYRDWLARAVEPVDPGH